MGTRFGIAVGSWPEEMPPPGFYTELARKAEEFKYEFLFATDHIFIDNPMPDALTILGTYAAVTTNISIGTTVLLPALREPAVAAKQLATIDYLSQGRLILGVGVGGAAAAEWAAMEVPRESRGDRTDEYLSLFRKLWAGGEVNFEGRFRSVKGVVHSPRPHQVGGPPIWIGGRSAAALERASRHQGWCAYLESPNKIAEKIDAIGEQRGNLEDFSLVYCIFVHVGPSPQRAKEYLAASLEQRYGQSFEHLIDRYCAAGTVQDVASRLLEYKGAGVEDFVFMPHASSDQYHDQIARLAEVAEIIRQELR